MADVRYAEDPASHSSHHHCHFPVSKAHVPKDQKSIRYIRIPIFSDDESQKEQRAHVAHTHGQVLLSAWAVLLHNYTGSEVVSFAAFCCRDSPDERNTTDAIVSNGDRSGVANSSDGCDGSILRYQVSDNTCLHDVCKMSKEPLTAGGLSRGGPVNTATDFTGWLEFVSCGQHEEEEKEELSGVQLMTRHWSNNDCVRSSLSLYQFVLMLHPIEVETAFYINGSRNF